jgi:hypothetical protein
MKKTLSIFIFLSLFNLTSGQTTTKAEDAIVGAIPEIHAIFPGGHPAFKKYIDENVTKKIELEKNESEVLRKAFAKFTIDQNGFVDSVSIIKTSNINRLDTLLVAALKNMPKWSPATLNGKPIRERWNFPFTIHLK